MLISLTVLLLVAVLLAAIGRLTHDPLEVRRSGGHRRRTPPI